MQPKFMQIKSALIEQIELRQLLPGEKVPSENQLADQFSVSRMTARRAVSELVSEKVLARSQGIGTFVADLGSMPCMIELPEIDEQIKARGHHYSNAIIDIYQIQANQQQSIWMGVAPNALLFNAKIVHKENDLAIQLEDVLVNPALAPDFDKQDFMHVNSCHYLHQVAPFIQVEHSIEAILPNAKLASVLDIAENQACIKICRKIFSTNGVVSYARLYHGGNRFKIGQSFDSKI